MIDLIIAHILRDVPAGIVVPELTEVSVRGVSLITSLPCMPLNRSTISLLVSPLVTPEPITLPSPDKTYASGSGVVFSNQRREALIFCTTNSLRDALVLRNENWYPKTIMPIPKKKSSIFVPASEKNLLIFLVKRETKNKRISAIADDMISLYPNELPTSRI